MKKLGLACLAVLTSATAVQAQDAGAASVLELNYILSSFAMLVFGILVMMMAVGFTMLEAGFVRKKNVVMQLTKNVGLFVIAAICFFAAGYGLMRADGSWLIQGLLGTPGPLDLGPVSADAGAAPGQKVTQGSDFFFQMMFCAAAASIVSGALAERVRLWAFFVFVAVLTGFLYPIGASWAWADGGFLAAQFGFKDFAGSTIVHSAGGWAALAGAIVVGPRLGKYTNDGYPPAMPPSNMTLAVLGMFFLWFGWFGFNAGSLGSMDSAEDIGKISRIFVNTALAGAAGAVAALLFTKTLFRMVDTTMVMNGTLAGLVAITAEPVLPSSEGALIIGAIGGLIACFGIMTLDRLRVDDVVGAIPVHLMSGIWGTIAVIFSNPDATLLGQLAGVVAIGGLIFIPSLIVWRVIAWTVGARAHPEDEQDGLDVSELGAEAYPEFADARLAS